MKRKIDNETRIMLIAVALGLAGAACLLIEWYLIGMIFYLFVGACIAIKTVIFHLMKNDQDETN